jgi:pimeloyl-ACP methyl ester carboxylesterase
MRRRHFLGVAGASGLAVATGTSSPPTAAVAHARGTAAGGYDDELARTDLWTRGDNGERIFVREVVASGRSAGSLPLLLVHGARPDGTSAFDLPVAGGSLAADLARDGCAVYVMDLRGYGHSDYPPEMTEPAEASSPLVRSDAAIADIGTAVRLIRRRHRSRRLAALGWATGGHWLGMYAALHTGDITDLMVLNTLYSGTSHWSLQGELEDPDNPGEPLPQPGWRAVTADSLTARWDEGLAGEEDPDARRDPALREAYRTASLRVDPTSGTRTPPSFRNPTGPLIDAFYLAQGRQFYDASLIRARTLVLRGERDFWSRPEDAERLGRHLTGAPEARVRILPGATHYLHLERPEHGRARLLDEVRSFLGR